MIGFRGASRYYSPRYRPGFALECKAIKYVREKLGLRNVTVMIPFCRTLDEADKVLQVMADEGLARSDDFKVYVMCEIPSNVILAKEFAKRFDGFSIGSNDLTQLTLGIDRDSEQVRLPAVHLCYEFTYPVTFNIPIFFTFSWPAFLMSAMKLLLLSSAM